MLGAIGKWERTLPLTICKLVVGPERAPEVLQVDTPKEVEFSVWYHIAVAAAESWVPSCEYSP